MPKLYEYFGLHVLFYSNDHYPVHVHGKFQDRESKAEILMNDGQIVEIRFAEVLGKVPLDKSELKKFKRLVEVYKEDIVLKWIDFFIYNKNFEVIKINKELK